MKRSLGILAGTAVGALLLWAASAIANHVGGEPNEEEVTCQVKSAQIYGKFVAKKASKVIKCEKGERSGANPATDCEPPYGGETGTAIGEVQAATTAKHQDACSTDCPECYSGGDCVADGISRTSGVESQVDAFHSLVWCDDTTSGDGLNDDEAKCQDAVAKLLAKGVKKVTKIASTCIKKEHAGDVAPGGCYPTGDPDNPLVDPTYSALLAEAIDKTIAKIDDKCALTDNPECYSPNYDTGAEWVANVQSQVEGNYTNFFCGS